MDNYAYLMQNISVGSNDKLTADLTEEQANELLELAIKKFNLIRGKNNNAEGSKYFAYVGGFPSYHLALDNKSGTTRLHTITTVEQLNKIN